MFNNKIGIFKPTTDQYPYINNILILQKFIPWQNVDTQDTCT